MNNEIKVIVLQGLPASGKSTHAREWVNEDPKNRVRVNRDDLRRMCGPYWVPSREKYITLLEKECVHLALMQGKDIIIDATNFRNNWEKFIRKELGYGGPAVRVITEFIDTPLEECLRRDKERKESVGEEVIMRMYNKYLK